MGLAVVGGLISHPSWTAFPSLSYFPTFHWCFLHSLDKLSALKPLTQGFSGHFHYTISHLAKMLGSVGGHMIQVRLVGILPGILLDLQQGERSSLSFLLHFICASLCLVE
jgi:hypothetical protein